MTGPEDPSDETSESTWLPGDPTPEGWTGREIPTPSVPGPTVDPVTGQPVGRFIVSSERPDQGIGAQAMVEPEGGHTYAYPDEGSPETHTTYSNWSNYNRFNPEGHPEQKWESSQAPHGHYQAEGKGLGSDWKQGWQGSTLDFDPATGTSVVVNPGSGAAHQRLLGTPTGDGKFEQAYDAAVDRDKYQAWLRNNAGPGQARLDAEQQAQQQADQDQQDAGQHDADQQDADQQAPADGAEQTPSDGGEESGNADAGTGDSSAVDDTGDSADGVDDDNLGSENWLQADDSSGQDDSPDGDSGSGGGDGQGDEGGNGDAGDDDSTAMLNNYDASWADSGDGDGDYSGGDYSGGDSESTDYSTADYSSGGDSGSDD
jgi:hypothetical protein